MRDCIYSLVILLLILGGCHSNDPIMLVLSHADSVLDSLPDSALNILRAIDTQDLKTSEVKARHSLLLTMALLKTDQEVPSDSILAPAIEYFGKNEKPSRETMLTHFAMAALSDSAVRKIEEYDKTIELAAGKNIKTYKALALFNKGNVYGQARNSPEELECIKKGLDIIRETNDTPSIIYGHLIYGMGLNSKGQFSDAMKEFIIGLDISAKSGIDTYVPLLSREKGYTHSLLGQDDKATAIFDSLLRKNNVEFTPEDLFAFARSAAATGNFALADQIMDSSADVELPEEKCDFYYSRGRIMASKGDFKGAYNLSDSIFRYSNIVVMETLDRNLSRQEKEIAMLNTMHQQQLADRLRIQMILIAICSITVVALLIAGIYILILRHRREIKVEELKRVNIETKAKAQEDTLITKIEQLNSTNNLNASTLQTLKSNIEDLESQKHSLQQSLAQLQDNILTLKMEIASKEHDRALMEEKANIYAETIKSLKSQLKANDATIARIRRQSREDFLRIHKDNAAFCNDMPPGLSSPAAIDLYECQRDLKIKQYSDPAEVKNLETQINDLFDNMLSELTKSVKLSPTDVTTLIYCICGFTYKSISRLLNASPSAAAARRSRIKEKISALNHLPEIYEQYLNLN